MKMVLMDFSKGHGRLNHQSIQTQSYREKRIEGKMFEREKERLYLT
jgi:hypothetical protein